MGGDFAPDAIVQGAVMASQQLPEDAEIVLIGQEEVVRACLQKHGSASSRITVVHASQVIAMGEHPTKALTQKPDSSIAKGYQLLQLQQIDAFCSAGNTGAMLVGAMFSVKAVPGVLRPGIAGFVPKVNGTTGIILDVGANAECKPEVLEQFGELGSIYAQYVLGITQPKVGLMNLGEEEGKGTAGAQQAHQLLKNNPELNFIGNIEGRDLFNDKADVIVCDGFIGNVILKLSESIYDILLSKAIQDPYFDQFNYEAIGGSPILGINGNAIIGHGVSSPTATCNMLQLAYKVGKSGIIEQIQKTFSS
jgi:glycerol-3-phosphate acyltransferase PlsX